MPNFWDSLKSVGVQAASTAGQVYQSTLGTLSGVANNKIDMIANKVQAQVGSIVKPANTPSQNNPKPPAAAPVTPAQSAGLGVAGLVIAAIVIFFLMRKK